MHWGRGFAKSYNVINHIPPGTQGSNVAGISLIFSFCFLVLVSMLNLLFILLELLPHLNGFALHQFKFRRYQFSRSTLSMILSINSIVVLGSMSSFDLIFSSDFALFYMQETSIQLIHNIVFKELKVCRESRIEERQTKTWEHGYCVLYLLTSSLFSVPCYPLSITSLLAFINQYLPIHFTSCKIFWVKNFPENSELLLLQKVVHHLTVLIGFFIPNDKNRSLFN